MEAAIENQRLPLGARIPSAVLTVMRWTVLLYLTFAVVCLGFFANGIAYSFYGGVTKEGVPWLILSAMAAGALATVGFWALGRTKALQMLEDRKRFIWFVIIDAAVLFAVQMIIAGGVNFIAGSDSGVLTDVPGQQENSEYLSVYPNNLYPAGLFTLIWQAADAVGSDPFFWLTAGGCLSVTLAVGLAAMVAYRIRGAVCGFAVFIIGAAWLGISPMAQVPYTDSYGALWPVLTLFFFVYVSDVRIKWPLIAVASVLGFAMKAPALAMLGGIVVAGGCTWLSQQAEQKAARIKAEDEGKSGAMQGERKPLASKTIAVALVGCLAAAAVSACAAAAIRTIPDVDLDPEKEIGVAHYLMLGVGPSRGVYSPELFEFSTSFDTKEERTAANLAVWQERLNMLGPMGLADLALSKTMTTFGSGAFFWGGDAMLDIRGKNSVLRSLYGLQRDTDGRARVDAACPWNQFAQVVWYAVLLGCALNLLRRRVDPAESAICIALLLFCIYALIFEANPRYPFIFAPLFLILSVSGWSSLWQRIVRRLPAQQNVA